jgi:hypothetical protein
LQAPTKVIIKKYKEREGCFLIDWLCYVVVVESTYFTGEVAGTGRATMTGTTTTSKSKTHATKQSSLIIEKKRFQPKILKLKRTPTNNFLLSFFLPCKQYRIFGFGF